VWQETMETLAVVLVAAVRTRAEDPVPVPGLS
jgi:hypothetical protein